MRDKRKSGENLLFRRFYILKIVARFFVSTTASFCDFCRILNASFRILWKSGFADYTSNPAELWNNLPEQDDFLESMAEACKAVIDHTGDKILYINVANRLSVDCDCNGDPAEPKMGDLGILASLDPVALDRACVDMVFNSNDPCKTDLIERINSRHGTHILEHAESLGLGSQKYKIVTIE